MTKEIVKRNKKDMIYILIMLLLYVVTSFWLGTIVGEKLAEKNNCSKYVESYNEALEYIEEQRKYCGIIYEVPEMKEVTPKWKQNTYMTNPTLAL